MQKQEKIKKLLIILAALSLFCVSYYYYVHKSEKTPEKQTQKAEIKKVKKVSQKTEKKIEPENKKDNDKEIEKKQVKDTETTVSKETPKAETVNKQEENKEAEIFEPQKTEEPKKKIKPTDKSDLINIAFATAGKKDPFSYRESRFSPMSSNHSGVSQGLPAPPSAGEKSGDGVEIKGFFGNKVIAEVNGHTDSLSAGETFRGVKVLKIDSKNFSCIFEINGKRVTKKLKPISKPDKDVEIKYLNN